MKAIILNIVLCGLIFVVSAKEEIEKPVVYYTPAVASKFSWLNLNSPQCRSDPDYGQDVPGLIRNKGFPVETHIVKTSDGYFLTLHRIPNGNGYNGDQTKKPIMFLQHGLMGSSSNYVMNYEDSSLGFIAHNQGYDVWMGNFRGNTYSKKHIKWDALNPRFWKFSWDEMAMIDLPDMIDYVLKNTGQSALRYVGHSMGTTAALAFLADKTEYQKKVISVALLSPVIFVTNSLNPAFKLTPIRHVLTTISRVGGTTGELFPNSVFYINFVKEFCAARMTEKLCNYFIKTIFREGPAFNETRLCVYLDHFPAGSSSYSPIHFAQVRKAKAFRKYDFGLGNYLAYKKWKPPTYDLSAIKVPVALFWSTGDDLNHPNDIATLDNELGNVALNYKIDDTKFSHLDFAIGNNAKDQVYPALLEFFKKH